MNEIHATQTCTHTYTNMPTHTVSLTWRRVLSWPYSTQMNEIHATRTHTYTNMSLTWRWVLSWPCSQSRTSLPQRGWWCHRYRDHTSTDPPQGEGRHVLRDQRAWPVVCLGVFVLCVCSWPARSRWKASCAPRPEGLTYDLCKCMHEYMDWCMWGHFKLHIVLCVYIWSCFEHQMCVYTCIHTYTHASIRTYILTYTRIHTHIHTCTYLRLLAKQVPQLGGILLRHKDLETVLTSVATASNEAIHSANLCICVYIYVCIYIYIYIYIHTHTFAFTYVCISTFAYVYMYVCIYNRSLSLCRSKQKNHPYRQHTYVSYVHVQIQKTFSHSHAHLDSDMDTSLVYFMLALSLWEALCEYLCVCVCAQIQKGLRPEG
jgi:hypothetical protein